MLRQRLVGRAGELRDVDRALAALERGRPATLELLGEPGIGKSRLLAELCSLATERGHLVLSGTASELERDLPFWVFVDAIDDYLQTLEPRRLDALGAETRRSLAVVFPSLAQFAVPAEGALQHERYRSHRAARELLERLTATAPLVLALDDVHWADPASVELIGALLRSPPDAAVLIAVASGPARHRGDCRRPSASMASGHTDPTRSRRPDPRRGRGAARRDDGRGSRGSAVRGQRR